MANEIEILEDYKLDNPNYDIDEDAVYKKHETALNADLDEADKTFGEMASNMNGLYQQQIDAINQNKEEQIDLQNERTDFTIQQINQQKEKAQKDYTKEQSGAYVDWQKQSNQYGVNAEKMAGSGLTNTGYSESSQVSMYNAYQNRIAVAREVLNQSILNYDNAIKDAQLQNNSALAEIAFKAQEEQLQFVFESALQQNTLLIEKANKQQQIQEMYYSRYLDELDQLNKENALAEEIRQYNLKYNQTERENELALEQWKKEIEMEQAKLKQEQDQFDALHPEAKTGGHEDKVKEINKSALDTPTSPKVEVAGMPDQPLNKPTTYEDAVKYMKQMGVDGTRASSVMTKAEWTRRKASYNSTGVGSAEVKVNGTYAEYLADYCAFAIADEGSTTNSNTSGKVPNTAGKNFVSIIK